MAWDFDGPPMHAPGAGKYYRKHYPAGLHNDIFWPLPWEAEGDAMPRKKPTSLTTVPAVPAQTPGILYDALHDAQDRILALEHRVEMAETETQRSIDTYNRELQNAHAAEKALLEKIAALQEQGTTASSPSGMPAPLPPTQWQVRQAENDAGLETLLNTLSQDGWQIDTIFRPRQSRYHVVAWRVEAQA